MLFKYCFFKPLTNKTPAGRIFTAEERECAEKYDAYDRGEIFVPILPKEVGIESAKSFIRYETLNAVKCLAVYPVLDYTLLNCIAEDIKNKTGDPGESAEVTPGSIRVIALNKCEAFIETETNLGAPYIFNRALIPWDIFSACKVNREVDCLNININSLFESETNVYGFDFTPFNKSCYPIVLGEAELKKFVNSVKMASSTNSKIKESFKIFLSMYHALQKTYGEELFLVAEIEKSQD